MSLPSVDNPVMVVGAGLQRPQVVHTVLVTVLLDPFVVVVGVAIVLPFLDGLLITGIVAAPAGV